MHQLSASFSCNLVLFHRPPKATTVLFTPLLHTCAIPPSPRSTTTSLLLPVPCHLQQLKVLSALLSVKPSMMQQCSAGKHAEKCGALSHEHSRRASLRATQEERTLRKRLVTKANQRTLTRPRAARMRRQSRKCEKALSQPTVINDFAPALLPKPASLLWQRKV